MKKILYCLSLIGLCLCACNSSSGNKNTNVVDDSKYQSVYGYTNVEYFIDNDLRFNVTYTKYSGSDESGYEIEYVKKWCVYLNGYYYLGNAYATFYECVKYRGGTDYYIVH